MTDMSEHNIAEDLKQISAVDQYLTFRVGDEDYGVPILNVQEIRGWESVARVPNTPSYVKGVLNLRGTAVPVIDLRQRMQQPRAEYDATTVVIILRNEMEGEERICGIVVDEVSDVMNTGNDDIRKTPDFGDRVDTAFIQGLVDVGGRMVMLFAVDEFMRHPDLYDPPEEEEEA
jgi:purine-binding chemotaxis protein CheW